LKTEYAATCIHRANLYLASGYLSCPFNIKQNYGGTKMYTIDEIKANLPEMESHPAASKLPMMQGEELRALMLGLVNDGMRNKIWIIGNQILDGRSRYAALRALKAEGKLSFVPDIAEWPTENDDLDSVVLSMNIHRKHYNKQQLAIYAARNLMSSLKQEAILRMHKKVPTELFPEVNKGTANSLAASLVGTNEKYVQWACKINDRNEHYLDFVMQKLMSLQEGIEFIEMKAEEKDFFFERMKVGMKFREIKTLNEEQAKSGSATEQVSGQGGDHIDKHEDAQMGLQEADKNERSENIMVESKTSTSSNGDAKYPSQDATLSTHHSSKLVRLDKVSNKVEENDGNKSELGIVFPKAIHETALEEIAEVLHRHGYCETPYKILVASTTKEVQATLESLLEQVQVTAYEVEPQDMLGNIK
jgi:hypothetical protein